MRNEECRNCYFIQAKKIYHLYRREKQKNPAPLTLIITGIDLYDIGKYIINYFSSRNADVSENVLHCDKHTLIKYSNWSFMSSFRSVSLFGDSLTNPNSVEVARWKELFEFQKDLIFGSVSSDIKKGKKALSSIGFNVIIYKCNFHDEFCRFTRIAGEECPDTFPLSKGGGGCFISAAPPLSDYHEVMVPLVLDKGVINTVKVVSECLENKIEICPYCCKGIFLRRDSEKEPWRSDNQIAGVSQLEQVHSNRGFTNHVKSCKRRFERDEIIRIDTDEQKEVLYQYAFFSKRDAGWDFSLVDKNLFDNGAVVYGYVENHVLLGYVAFHPKDGEHFSIWDLYTLPSMRRRGIATRLLKHGIRELSLNPDRLWVSLPVTDASEGIITRLSTSGIICDPFGREVQI